MYKISTAFLFVTVLFGCTNGKKNVPAELKMDVSGFQKIIHTLFKERDALISNRNSDSLEIINDRIADTVIKYRSLLFDPDDSMPDPLAIAISRDRKISIVSWNTYEGGTMTDFRSFIFYKTTAGEAYMELGEVDSGDTLHSLYWYDTIVSIAVKDRNIYIAKGYGRGSTRLFWEELKAFELVNDTLKQPAIFPEYAVAADAYPQVFSTTNYQNTLGIEFDIQFWNSSNLDQLPTTVFQNQNRLLKVPKTSDNGGTTKEYLILEFDGIKFVAQ
jgi:hypothetical protein